MPKRHVIRPSTKHTPRTETPSASEPVKDAHLSPHTPANEPERAAKGKFPLRLLRKPRVLAIPEHGLELKLCSASWGASDKEKCPNAHFANGWCLGHYAAIRKHFRSLEASGVKDDGKWTPDYQLGTRPRGRAKVNVLTSLPALRDLPATLVQEIKRAGEDVGMTVPEFMVAHWRSWFKVRTGRDANSEPMVFAESNPSRNVH